jgi:hypothetical protein
MYEPPTKKQAAAFSKDARAFLDSLARVAQEDPPKYDVATMAGRLHITIYDDWLACRFDDVQSAVVQVRNGVLNPYSGKWNWHGLDVVPDFKRAMCAIALPL